MKKYLYYGKDGLVKLASDTPIISDLEVKEVDPLEQPEQTLIYIENDAIVFKDFTGKAGIKKDIQNAKTLDDLKKIILNIL